MKKIRNVMYAGRDVGKYPNFYIQNRADDIQIDFYDEEGEHKISLFLKPRYVRLLSKRLSGALDNRKKDVRIK